MSKVTAILSQEHEIILKLINDLEQECDALTEGRPLNQTFFEQALDFIREYADQFHHAKEEEILFVELTKNSAQMHCNPIPQMLHEHDLGRDFAKGLAEGLKKRDRKKIVTNARGYAELLKDHIYKEDNILYPMADETLSDKDQQALLKKFAIADKKLAKVKNKYGAF